MTHITGNDIMRDVRQDVGYVVAGHTGRSEGVPGVEREIE